MKKPVQITGARRSGNGVRGPTMFRMFLPFSAVSVSVDGTKLTLSDQIQVTQQLAVLPIECKDF